MELCILGVTVLIELVLAVYGWITRNNRGRIKSWTRIAMFSGFAVLVLSKVIVWHIAWGLFAGLLLILAVKESVILLRKRTSRTPASTRHIFSAIVKSVLVSLAAFVTLIPVLLFPQHESPQVTGAYPVDTAAYTYTDPDRMEAFADDAKQRSVNVEFWYPESANETYPLLVFSHGAFGIKTSNDSTFTELASHGYVVASIDHPYHSFYTVSDSGEVVTIDREYMREVSNANQEGTYSLEEFFELTRKWMKLRTDDMDFVLDTILKQNGQQADPIHERIDTEKIGVFGHSMGGAASVGLSRQREDIDAVVNIDAPFFSEIRYDSATRDLAAKSERYTIPLLNVYSDDVWVQLDSSSAYIANRLSNPAFSGAYTVHFEGAKHLSLTDLPLYSPFLANLLQGGEANIDKYQAIETQNKLILQFFDYTLKQQGLFNPQKTY